jgi:mannose-6-phosphate isomerase-like protein (cupin superfamily)
VGDSARLNDEHSDNKRQIMRQLVILSALLVLLASVASAQTPGSGVLNLSPSELQTISKLGENNPIKSIDAGKHTVFVWYEVRKPGLQDNGVLHSELTEIYLIVEGSAVMRTGGKLISSEKLVVPGMLPGTNFPRFLTPSLRGSRQSEGGVSRKVTVGDIIVIPPNTVHVWEAVDAPKISYVIFRIDPEHVLHGGYTNPSLQK